MKYRITKETNQTQAARALLDLLNENQNKHVEMSFSRANCGRANINNGRFTVPEHAFKNGETYLFYYVIHEFTHCLGYWGHGKDFKAVEQKLCDMFGIKIDYAKAYPKALYANGQKVYQGRKTLKS